MTIDYKKEFKNLYQPKTKPMMIDVEEIPYVCVKGYGNPNDENGEYQRALRNLYGISYTIKMSKKTDKHIPGYFDYVVPPLEGLWWMEGCEEPDFQHKEKFSWISMIRLPEFVDSSIFSWACEIYQKKHPEADLSSTYYWKYKEGLCVQILHKGSYDDEPATVEKLHHFLKQERYELDFNGKEYQRYHHEIYLNDPRKTKTENLKTIIRLPIKSII